MIAPKEFSVLEPGFKNPTVSDLYDFATLGLFSAQEQFQILSDWDTYLALGFFEDESYLAERVKEILSEYGNGIKGNFFTELPPTPRYRYWFDDNLVITRDEVIWGEELGFYELDDLCVSKSVMNNTHLIFTPSATSYSATHYVSGGAELTFTKFQITTNQDIFERFGIDLPCETVILVR